MGNFFKTLGKGILYFITLPLLVLFLAIYLVVSLIGFIIVGFKALILFFKGENITGKTAEDIEAEKRLDMWVNPIDHVLKEVEKIKANNETPTISMNANDQSIHVTGLPNNQNVNQIPTQGNMNQLPNQNPYQNSNIYPQQPMNQGYPNQQMMPPQYGNQMPPQGYQVPPQNYPNQAQNQGYQMPNNHPIPPQPNPNNFQPEPPEIKETRSEKFRQPDPNNIINEEDFIPENNKFSSINITPNPNNDNYDNSQTIKDPFYDDDETPDGVSFEEYLGDDKK